MKNQILPGGCTEPTVPKERQSCVVVPTVPTIKKAIYTGIYNTIFGPKDNGWCGTPNAADQTIERIKNSTSKPGKP